MRLECVVQCDVLFVFVLFDLLGVPLKSVILVFLFVIFFLSQTCAEYARAPTHNGLKCKWQFYTLCFVCLFLMFCFARCIRWRFGLLAPNMRATLCTCSLSPGVLAVCFCWCFCYLFLFNVYLWKFLRIVCVFFCSRGLNLSFLHHLFLSILLLNTNLLCLHWVLKTFTSSLIVYQLFFLLFLLIGFIIISFFSFGFFANLIFFLSFF